MKPFQLSLPPLRPKDSRRTPRRAAGGLSLTCTRAQATRLGAGAARNLAVALKDVGWGGLRFTATERPADSGPLEIRIREEGSGTLLHARGVVVWVKTRSEEGREIHDVGIRFQEVLAPAETCSRFFDVVSSDPTAGNTTVRRRRMDRFGIGDGDVVLEFDNRFRSDPRPGNLALGLVDLSRRGAQVACREPLKPGDRVRLTVRLRSFGDVFTADAEAVWIRPPASPGGTSWRAGLSFCGLDYAKGRQLQTFERFFSSSAGTG
ncbi:MAG TPA: PilZ domain-containing protein [Planctomycetota bacterium]|nr:PilZ domain-containing protein [Planctomycetota bacterium]